MTTERAETPLDSYLVSIKPSPSRDIKPTSTRPNPKNISLQDVAKSIKEKPAIQGGISEYNRAIRKTLGKEDNPVTNSTSYSRTIHVQSCATGHQGGGGGASGSKWTLHRNAKLRLQAADKQSDSLKGVIGYISGYTGNEVTNTQLRACVERQGGQMVTMASGRCTHIFITSNLSGSKAQKYFESNKKNKCKLVLPSWAFECEKLGKRVSESRFIAPIKHEAQTSAFEIYASKQTPSTSTSTSTSNLLSVPSATTTSPRKRSKLSTNPTDSSTSSSEELIILSPSPSPNSKTHHHQKRSPIKKKPKISPVKEKKKEKIEELLVLGSSDVELEDSFLGEKLKRPEKGGVVNKGKGKKKVESEEEVEELDEFGMPPSGQRR